MSENQQRIDERAMRTRNQIARAVIRIGTQRGVDRLTVGELAREAGVSRSTFYAHFGSLEDYLSQSFANMVAGYASHAARDAGPNDKRLLHVRLILEHVAAAPGYVAVISRSCHRPRMLMAGEERLGRLIDGRLRLLRPEMPQPDRSALAQFVAAGFISMLREWMESGLRRSVDDMESRFDSIAGRL